MGRVWGWGKRDGSPQGSGRGSQRPPCGVLPSGTERPFKQSQEGGDPGSKQGTEAPLCLTGRQPLLALRQRQATRRSGPRASLRQGSQPPQAAPRDDLAEALSYKREVLQLTHAGFAMADTLNESKKGIQTESP